MGTAPGDVAKALLDALPSIDHKKLLEEARRVFGIVIIGEEQSASDLLRLLRDPGPVPADSKAAIWRHVPGSTPPVPLGKTELAVIIPATDEYLKQAREAFGGVPTLPVVVGDAAVPTEVQGPVRLAALTADGVRKEIVPRIVDRLWERRLALGRAMPAARDRIVWQLIQRAVRDVKVLLGSVAGAGAGRSGVPTPATAQVLVHQAALIMAIGTVYGADIDDKVALLRRVTPNLTPSLVLDIAEARVTALAELLAGEEKYKKLYGTAAAVITRPTLTASSTLLAGLAARRVFRQQPEQRSVLARARARARLAGQRAASGIGQGAAAIAAVAVTRLRRSDADAPGTATQAGSTDASCLPEEHADDQAI